MLGVLRVPFSGSFLTFSVAALLYVTVTTSIGLIISTFMNSQIAAIFGAALMSLIPVVQFSGMTEPVSSLQGIGAFIGSINPAAHFMIIARGTFSKGLGFADLSNMFLPLLIAIPVLLATAAVLLKKQAR